MSSMSRFANLPLLHLLLPVLLLSGITQAQQLRKNRYSARIEEADSADGEVAVVKEISPTPYPAAGYRPGRAFNLPGEDEDVVLDADEEGSGLATTTTELPTDFYTTATGAAIEAETTTRYNWVPTELLSDNAAKQGRAAKAPYPPSGWRPSRAFLLPTEVKAIQEAEAAAATEDDSDVIDALTTSTAIPLAPFTTSLPAIEDETEVNVDDAAVTAAPSPPVVRQQPKAPYPPSGWRPSRAFLLPTEIKVAANQESSLSVNEPESPVSPADKAGHPPCGVSDNPMSPKPAEGAKENPDAERVYVTANLGPDVVNSPLSLPLMLRSERLISPPINVPAGRPFAFSATVQSWR